jgi:DNA-binding CsgD family transcriptional regulator/tetratricopeptide (TPR) repeat protein
VADRQAGLLERSDELANLQVRAAEAARGSGSACLIEGAAGTGKTTLLGACREISTEEGLKTLRARAGALERDLAWNLVRQLFAPVIDAPAQDQRDLLAGAASLSTPALGLGSGADQDALHGLYWLTTNLARREPLLIAVDDAHWGDLPSLRYLAYIGERVSDLPVLVAVTTRSGELDHAPLTTLASRATSQSFLLHELSASASADLVQNRMGADATDEFCASCHQATNGNPFLLEELLTQLQREGLDPTGADAGAVSRVTPPAIARSLLLRLIHLGPSARELASAVAVLGDATELRFAAALAGLDSEEAARAADDLAAASILNPGAPLEFAHPIVREVIYAELPKHDRARRHAGAARVLADAGAGSARVAAQLLEAEPQGSAWAIERLREAAAEAVAAGAPGPAIDLLERALREQPEAPTRAKILLDLGFAEASEALGGADRMREALASASDPQLRAAIGLALGRTIGLGGRHAEAVEVFERALREPHEDGELQLRLRAELAGHCLHAAEKLPLGFEMLAAVDTDATPAAPAERLLRVMAAFALISAGRISSAGAREIAIEAAGDRGPFEEHGSSLVFFIAETLVFADYLEDATAMLDELIAEARARGSRPGVALASAFRAQAALRRGAVAEAETDGRTAFEVVDPEVLGYCRPYALSFFIDALVERDALEEADELLGMVGPSAQWPQLWQFGLLIGSRGRLRLAEGRAAEAAEDLLACGERLSPWRPRNPGSVPWRSDAAVALAASGERTEAKKLVEWELGHARALSAPRAIGAALRAAGVVEGGPGGIELLRQAVAELEGSGAPLEQARALVDLGAMIRRSGSRADARVPLQRGIELARCCGAKAVARRGSDELSATGTSVRPALGGVESLTASELRVARMAAEGRTNREIAQALFVSLRTVETHLTHTYQKLDISRAELGAALDGERAP